MSPPTNCPPFYSFSSDPCSGHGQCIDTSTFTTTTTTTFSHLCACDAGWSGASDMFDLRILTHPITNQVLSLDCTTSTTTTYVFYALLLLTHVIRQVILIKALQTKFKHLPAKELQAAHGSYIKALWNYMPTRVLLCENIIANPLILVACIQRLATVGSGMNEMVYGTSPSFTVTMALGIMGMFTFFSDFSISQFRTLATSRMLSPENGALVVKRFKQGQAAEWFLYFVSSFLCPIIALGLNKSSGPIVSNEAVLLVFRNCGVVLMMALRFWNAHSLIREVEAILVPIKNLSAGAGGKTGDSTGTAGSTNNNKVAVAEQQQQHHGNDGGSGSTNRTGAGEAAARVLDYLKAQQKEMKKTAMVGGTCYFIWSIPPFWSWQMACQCFIVSLGSISNNEGLVFLRANKEAAKQSSGQQGGGAGGAGGGGGTQLPLTSHLQPMRSNLNMTLTKDADSNQSTVGGGQQSSFKSYQE
jgi:hypothetical protein